MGSNSFFRPAPEKTVVRTPVAVKLKNQDNTPQIELFTTYNPIEALAEMVYDYLARIKDSIEDSGKPHQALEAGHFDLLIRTIEQQQRALIPACAKDKDRLSKLIELTMNDRQDVIKEIANSLHTLALDAILKEPAYFNLHNDEAVSAILSKAPRSNPLLTDTFLQAIARNVLACPITYVDLKDDGLLPQKNYYGYSPEESNVEPLALKSNNGAFQMTTDLNNQDRVQHYVLKERLFISIEDILKRREQQIRHATSAFFNNRKELIELLRQIDPQNEKSDEELIAEQHAILCDLNIKSIPTNTYGNGLQQILSDQLLQHPNRFPASHQEELSDTELEGSNNSLLNGCSIMLAARKKDLGVFLEANKPELLEEAQKPQILVAAC